ncbi:MAG: sugar transporter substrate-binding protein [Clostridia bacterium]|jgi:multiple sugar transport system substrate-binding protein|nr:sugar transporter substrate-binding protein [Clostridia bacterium]
MKKLKKIVSLFTAMLLVGSVFTGCSQKASTSAEPATKVEEAKDTAKDSSTQEPAKSEEPIKLTFVNWGSAEDSTKPAFDAMCNKFTELNPNITIEQVAYPYNSIKDQLLIMSSGGNAPDLAQVKTEWVVSLNNAKVLAPLDDLLPKEAIDDYFPGLLAGTKYDGKMVSAPWAPSPIMLYYNKTLMQKAGYTEPPKTWAELMEQAEKIAALGKDENGNKVYGLGLSSKKLPGAGYFFLLNMWQNGGELVDDTGKVVVDSPGNIAALTEAQKLIKSGISPEGLEIKELRNLFAQGQVGFHFDMEAGISVFEKGSPKGKEFQKEYGITFIPGADSEKGNTFAVEHHLVAFNDSKNKEAVGKFIDFLTGPEGMKVYNENNGNKLPARNSVKALEFYTQEQNAMLKPFVEALDFARALPTSNEGFLVACEDIAEAVQRVSMNNEDPGAVVKELDKKVKDKYKQ